MLSKRSGLRAIGYNKDIGRAPISASSWCSSHVNRIVAQLEVSDRTEATVAIEGNLPSLHRMP
jgi:DNA-binding NarL/FixJ family response regulator